MKIVTNFLIGGVLGAAESIPMIGPFVVFPLRQLGSAAYSIGKLSLNLLGLCVTVLSLGCLLANRGICVLSSAGCGIYHLFAKTPKSKKPH